MRNLTIILFFFTFLFLSCEQKKFEKTTNNILDDDFRFDLKSPFKKFELPDVLREISGINAVNDSLIACINDEIGVVYFYNLNSNEIDHKIKFTGKGDFEDLVVVNDTIYILESNGTIWEIQNYKKNPRVESYFLLIEPPFELEGLARQGDRLFVAAKYFHKKERGFKGQLPVWKLSPGFQIEKSFFSLPDLIKAPGGHTTAFNTSALLYDELTDHWFCLSTNENVFIQCGNNGDLISIQGLSDKIFLQPEGMCFTISGDLLISNEGKGGNANILLFTDKKKL